VAGQHKSRNTNDNIALFDDLNPLEKVSSRLGLIVTFHGAVE
jgi:hypothetical protein